MPCHGCAANFSLFTKELSCTRCGFSFCSKCIKEKVNIDDKEQKVCTNCVREVSNKSVFVHEFDPPALLLKRLETLENPAKPPITIFKHKGKLSGLKSGLSTEDQQILDRLEKLKEDRKAKNLPSETELNQRLLILKGLKEQSMEEKKQVLQPPLKSEEEEVNQLLNQYLDEVILEKNLGADNEKKNDDIEVRLQKLKMSDSSKEKELPMTSYEADDGDTVTKRIIKKAIAEGELEKKHESLGKADSDDESHSLDSENEDSDLPWCIICNEDATVKCFSCDGSLYCESCFKQGHEFFEMGDHKIQELNKEKS